MSTESTRSLDEDSAGRRPAVIRNAHRNHLYNDPVMLGSLDPDTAAYFQEQLTGSGRITELVSRSQAERQAGAMNKTAGPFELNANGRRKYRDIKRPLSLWAHVEGEGQPRLMTGDYPMPGNHMTRYSRRVDSYLAGKRPEAPNIPDGHRMKYDPTTPEPGHANDYAPGITSIHTGRPMPTYLTPVDAPPEVKQYMRDREALTAAVKAENVRRRLIRADRASKSESERRETVDAGFKKRRAELANRRKRLNRNDPKDKGQRRADLAAERARATPLSAARHNRRLAGIKDRLAVANRNANVARGQAIAERAQAGIRAQIEINNAPNYGSAKPYKSRSKAALDKKKKKKKSQKGIDFLPAPVPRKI